MNRRRPHRFLPHPRSGPAEGGADAVLGDAHVGADLVVAFSFEMIEPHDFGFCLGKAVHQLLDFVPVVEAFFRGGNVAVAVLVLSFRLPLQDAGFARSQGGYFPLKELADNDPAGYDGQVSRKAASTSESPQNGKVVSQDGEENFSREVFAVLLGNLECAGVSGVVDDMDHETDEAVYEVLPRAGLTVQATLEQLFVDFG